MVTIENINDLRSHDLSLNDTVIFTINDYRGYNGVIHYEVRDDHMNTTYSNITKHGENVYPRTNNDIIFDVLGVSKYTYCSIAYEYITNTGIFPVFENYEQLKKLIEQIYNDLGDKKTVIPTIITEENKKLIIEHDNIKISSLKMSHHYEFKPSDDNKIYLTISITEDLKNLLKACCIDEKTDDGVYIDNNKYVFNRYKIKNVIFSQLGEYKTLLFDESLLNNNRITYVFKNRQKADTLLKHYTSNIKTIILSILNATVTTETTFKL